MKSNTFSGFWIIFKYNLKQHMKTAKYLSSTILIALILIAGITGLIVFLSEPETETSDYKYDVKEIYVIDETKLGVPDYKGFASMLEEKDIAKTNFIETTESAEKVLNDKEADYLLIQKCVDDEYVLEVITGKNVDTSDEQVDANLSCLEEFLSASFQNHIYATSGLTGEQIVKILLPVETSIQEIAEDGSTGDEVDDTRMIIGIICIFVFVMLVYFMVLIYGVQICSDVPTEKTSKLVEQMLLSVTPTALVSGKILSMICSCIIQFIIWVLSIVAGIVLGNNVAMSVYDSDASVVSLAIEMLGKWFNGIGFSIPSIIMMVVLTCLGLIFYLLLAGISGSALSKPEAAGNVQAIFVLPLVISFLTLLYATDFISGNYNIPLIYNLIPFTAALSAPASVLLGTLSIPMAIVSALITIAVSFLLLYLAAKIYKGLLFFNGKKIKPKDIILIFKK